MPPEGGGKFANGAQMGAFGYLFNQCAHEKLGCSFSISGGSAASAQSGNGSSSLGQDIVGTYNEAANSGQTKTALAVSGAALELVGFIPTPLSPVFEAAGYTISVISFSLDPSPNNFVSNMSGLGGKAFAPYSQAVSAGYNQGHFGYSVYDAATTTKEKP
jgi:hypothetical protein